MTQSEPGNNQPSAPAPGSTKNKMLVVAVVVVVIVAAAVGFYYVYSHKGNGQGTNSPTYHLGTVSPARVANMSGKNFTTHYNNRTSSNSSGNSSEVASNEVLFNETAVSSIPAYILIQSIEFDTTAQANSDYNRAYVTLAAKASPLNITIKNGTFKGFTYFTAVYSETVLGITISVFLAVGQAAQYEFVMEDMNVALTNSTALVQAEVSAMS